MSTPSRWNITTYRKLIQSTRWRKLRNQKITDQPLCESCLSIGKYTPATEVHHIKPIERGSTHEEMERLAYDYNNLQSLCRECHTQAHRELNSFSPKLREQLKIKQRELEYKKLFGMSDVDVKKGIEKIEKEQKGTSANLT